MASDPSLGILNCDFLQEAQGRGITMYSLLHNNNVIIVLVFTYKQRITVHFLQHLLLCSMLFSAPVNLEI